MCEINPRHSAKFILEAFTTHPMTKEEFEDRVREKLVNTEITLNEDGSFRFHIHEWSHK